MGQRGERGILSIAWHAHGIEFEPAYYVHVFTSYEVHFVEQTGMGEGTGEGKGKCKPAFNLMAFTSCLVVNRDTPGPRVLKRARHETDVVH